MLEIKILIIDANADSSNFIARTLLEQNYIVIQAGSGREGLISAWRDHPDLVIIDPTLSDLSGEEIGKKIRQDPRTLNIPLIALSSDPNPARQKDCLNAGFNDYIIKSGQAVSTLNETINRLLGISVAAALPPAPIPATTSAPSTPVPSIIVKEGGMLMVVLSAKGGVGTSTLSANIAMNIAQNERDARVAVMDMVLPIGSIAPIVGYTGAQNIVTVADMPQNELSPEFFRDKLVKIKEWKIHLLAGCPDPESSNRLNVGRLWDIVSSLKMSYDYVLIDLGRSLSKFSLPIIRHADVVTLVVSPDLSTVTLTKTLLEYLKSKDVKPESIFPILNRAVGLEGLTKADVEKILGINIKFIVPHLGSNFTVSNNSHQPFLAQFPTDAASFLLKDIAKKMSALAHEARE